MRAFGGGGERGVKKRGEVDIGPGINKQTHPFRETCPRGGSERSVIFIDGPSIHVRAGFQQNTKDVLLSTLCGGGKRGVFCRPGICIRPMRKQEADAFLASFLRCRYEWRVSLRGAVHVCSSVNQVLHEFQVSRTHHKAQRRMLLRLAVDVRPGVQQQVDDVLPLRHNG